MDGREEEEEVRKEWRAGGRREEQRNLNGVLRGELNLGFLFSLSVSPAPSCLLHLLLGLVSASLYSPACLSLLSLRLSLRRQANLLLNHLSIASKLQLQIQ